MLDDSSTSNPAFENESDQRFRALVEHAADLIAILSPEGINLYASPAHTWLLGLEPGKLQGRNCFEFVHPDDAEALRAGFDAAMSSKGPTRPEDFRFTARGGGWVILSIVLTDMRDTPGVRGIVANSRDVTEERRLASRLRDAERLESIGRLAGGIAHDFNNMLTAILAFADLASLRPDALGPIQADLEEIRAAARRASALVKQLLAFSRAQVLNPRPTNINVALSGIESFLHRLLGPDVRLILRLMPDLPDTYIDPGQLEQVFVNLVLNAREAMPTTGAITIETLTCKPQRVEIMNGVEIPPGEYVCIRVADTGQGMNDETLAHIFDPYFTTKDHGDGAGLGLSMVYGFVKQSHGFITVDTTPGRGTTFTVLLPRLHG